MVWFYCDDCGDTIKKPKLANHFRSCRSQTFTCVDCSRNFDRQSAGAHNTCVSEHEKYALGATKPGGYAAQGFFHEGQAQQAAAAAADGAAAAEAVGLEFLSQRPPWRCACCNVSCTSRETLMGHAAGAKHKRRARAAAREAGGGQEQQQQQNGTSAAEPASADGSVKAQQEQEQNQEQQQQQEGEEAPASKMSDKKEKKDKKRKSKAAAAEEQQAGTAAKQQQEEQQKPKQKKSKKSKAAADAAAVEQPDTPDINGGAAEEQQQQQQQQRRMAAVLKVAVSKLKKKGKLGQKKLSKLLQEQQAAGQALLEAVKQQLLSVEGVKLQGGKTFTYATV